MKHFWKSCGAKVLICVAAFLIGMMIYAATTGFASLTGSVFSPIQSFVSRVSTGVHDLFSGSETKTVLSSENKELQEELNQLRKQQVELDELRRQNDLYKEFLGLKEENPDFTFVDARVIAADANDPYGNFAINKGTLNDVSVGDAVITPAGLVGAVYEAGLSFAKVRTILDPALQISCYDSRTREDGITSNELTLAKSGKMEMTQIARSATMTAGDIVVTYGGQYPPKLLVGEIDSVSTETTGLSKVAIIKPYVDVLSVSEVFVITDFEGALQ